MIYYSIIKYHFQNNFTKVWTVCRYASILTCKRIVLFILMFWLLCLTSSLPPLLGVCPLASNYMEGEAACLPTYTQSKVYPLVHIVTGVVLPISLMIGWNLKIVNIGKV